MKQRFITSRFGLVALVLLILSLLALVSAWDGFTRFDLPLYDLVLRHRKAKPLPVALVEVDRQSVNHFGSWPWPRRTMAELVGRIQKAGARGVALDFSLAGQDRSALDLAMVEEFLAGSLGGSAGAKLRRRFRSFKKKIGGDEQLADAVSAAGAVIGLDPMAEKTSLPPWLAPLSLSSIPAGSSMVPLANPWPEPWFGEERGLDLPPARIGRAAGSAGHRFFQRDGDGVVRRQGVFVRSGGRLIPSLPLAAFVDFNDRNLKDIRGQFASRRICGLTGNGWNFPLAFSGEMLIDFSRLRGVSVIPASRLMGGSKGDGLKGKMVIVGQSAAAGASVLPTPVGELSRSRMAAAATAGLLSPDHLFRPSWAWLLEIGVMVYLFFFVAMAGVRMGAVSGVVFFSVSALVWLLTASILLLAGGVWLRAVTPLLPGLCAYGLVFLFRNYSRSTLLDPAAIEDNKKVGLAFQSHGLLDLAMDKFMRLPASDPACRELLYNLALDLERKRMFAKAVTVYEQVVKNGGHRDSEARLARARQAEHVPHLARPTGADGTTAITGVGFTAPTIGRYEVVRELGQGAIGTVYLGRDPKINREVAIKTLRTSEVANDDLEEVKERFFREAEAAGSLNHPNIVTVYDIGEDDDMTYIAMELLSGRNLSYFCRPENLLGVDEVLRVIVQVASALAYAHKNKVVHRDIKPANIVMMEDGQVKVADFGIARLQTASTYTQTGAILGTPNYMSPEQVEGKKVDGRSDLFSLGVVAYEMLSGVKPFKHENVATLMHLIARADFVPLAEVREDMPSCVYEMIDKLLARAKSRRFQKADELEAAARECLVNLSRGMAADGP